MGSRSSTPPEGGAPGRRAGLSRRAITTEALRLIDERGLDALSMRTLGAALGVQAMSLYTHVPSKAALLDGVVELMLEELETGDPAGGDWRDSMAAFARSYRGIALRHPEAFRLFVQRPESGYRTAGHLAEEGLARLRDAGFSERDAILVLRTMSRFVIGFHLSSPPAGREPGAGLPGDAAPLAQRLVAEVSRGDDEPLFEFGLAALLAGMSPAPGA